MSRNSQPTARFSRRTVVGGAAALGAGMALGPRRRRVSAQGTVTLNVQGGVPGENGPSDLIDAFQQANPNIKVQYTRFVNDDTGNTTLDTALQGGTPIDVYFTYDVPRLSARTGAGAATDLAPYISADPDLKNWATTTDGVKTDDGVYYALPTALELTFILANKKMLDDKQIAVPDTWTFDDFQQTAKSLSSDSVYGAFAVPDEPRTKLGPNYWYKPDGTSSNFDDPAFKEQLQRWTGMITDGSAFPWSDVLAQNLRAYSQTPFLTGQDALWSTAPFSLRYVNDKENFPHDFVSTFIPAPKPAGVTDPWDLGTLNNWILMNSKTSNPDAAWTFIKYWLTTGAQYMLKGGKVPAFPGTSQDAIVAGILGPERDTLYDVDAFRKVLFAPNQKFYRDTITTGISQIAQIWQSETDKCLIGESSVDDCLATIKQQADAAIASAG